VLSTTLHKQLGILSDFINGFDFVKMTPDNSVIKGGIPEKATASIGTKRACLCNLYQWRQRGTVAGQTAQRQIQSNVGKHKNRQNR